MLCGGRLERAEEFCLTHKHHMSRPSRIIQHIRPIHGAYKSQGSFQIARTMTYALDPLPPTPTPPDYHRIHFDPAELKAKRIVGLLACQRAFQPSPHMQESWKKSSLKAQSRRSIAERALDWRPLCPPGSARRAACSERQSE